MLPKPYSSKRSKTVDRTFSSNGLPSQTERASQKMYDEMDVT